MTKPRVMTRKGRAKSGETKGCCLVRRPPSLDEVTVDERTNGPGSNDALAQATRRLKRHDGSLAEASTPAGVLNNAAWFMTNVWPNILIKALQTFKEGIGIALGLEVMLRPLSKPYTLTDAVLSRSRQTLARSES